MTSLLRQQSKPQRANVFALLDDAADSSMIEEWAQRLGERFPEVLEIHLVGSRVQGTASVDSDYDVIVVVRSDGELQLARFETVPSGQKAWGWLMPNDAARFRDGLDAPLDLMLVDVGSAEFRAVGCLFFAGVDANELVWKRRR